VGFPFPPAELAKLFDKNPSTVVLLPSGVTWMFKLKKTFEVNKIKILDTNLDYIDNLEITVYYPDKTTKVFVTQPVIVEAEAKWFSVKNLGGDVEVAEIIIEGMANVNLVTDQIIVEAEVITTEAKPLYTIREGYAISEQIQSMYLGRVPLTRQQIDALFSFDPTYQLLFPPQTNLEIYMKKPLKVKEYEFLTGVSEYPTFILSMSTIAFTPDTEVLPEEQEGQPFVEDKEISYIIAWHEGPEIPLSEIVIKLFDDARVFAQDPNGLNVQGAVSIVPTTEAEPMNTEQHQTLVAEDFELIKCTLNGLALTQEDLKRLFNKHGWGGDNVVINDYSNLTLELKNPMRLTTIKALFENSGPVGGITNIQAVGPYGETKTSEDNEPLQANIEVKRIIIINNEMAALTISQIVAEKFFDVRTFDQDPFVGYKSYEDSNFIVGDSPWVLDVLTDLGRLGKDGYIIIDGAGDVQLNVDEGTGYGDNITLKKGDIFKFKGMLVKLVKFTHISDTGIRMVIK